MAELSMLRTNRWQDFFSRSCSTHLPGSSINASGFLGRFFTIPIERAENLARAITEDAKGNPSGNQPEWWQDFQEQYLALPSNRKSAESTHRNDDPDDRVGKCTAS